MATQREAEALALISLAGGPIDFDLRPESTITDQDLAAGCLLNDLAKRGLCTKKEIKYGLVQFALSKAGREFLIQSAHASGQQQGLQEALEVIVGIIGNADPVRIGGLQDAANAIRQKIDAVDFPQ